MKKENSTSKKQTAAARAPHIRCVRMVPPGSPTQTFCGKTPDPLDSPFFNPDHAVSSALTGITLDGSRLETCPECRKAIVAALAGKIAVIKPEAAA